MAFTLVSSELIVPAADLEVGWLELTPLASDRKPLVVRLGDRRAEDGEKRLAPDLPAGPMMLCSGGAPYAVRCEEIYWQRRLAVAPEDDEIEVELATGVGITGRYLLDRWPVEGARVAVVPADLEAGRPYTQPLGRGAGGRMAREVVTDGGGSFVLPAIAEGRYFLETLLPSGRVHRGEPFDLPSERAVRVAAVADDVVAVSWDLGDIDVADGPVVEIRVRDPVGRPRPSDRASGEQAPVEASLERIGRRLSSRGLRYTLVCDALWVRCQRSPAYGQSATGQVVALRSTGLVCQPGYLKRSTENRNGQRHEDQRRSDRWTTAFGDTSRATVSAGVQDDYKLPHGGRGGTTAFPTSRGREGQSGGHGVSPHSRGDGVDGGCRRSVSNEVRWSLQTCLRSLQDRQASRRDCDDTRFLRTWHVRRANA